MAAVAGDHAIAAFVCDEWPEFVPDPFQTAGIGFHYDAPGARPPQSILLALPPQLGQDAWSFDDAVDVIHEAFDLARLRGVRPRDLSGGLGAVLPGNYLPHTYTDDLPSVRMLELMREARKRLVSSVGSADRDVHARQDLTARRHRAHRIQEDRRLADLGRRRSSRRSPASRGSRRNRRRSTCRPDCRRRWPTRCGCLSRQWQFNEFQGEDAGTPLRVQFAVQGVKVDAFRAGADLAAPWQPIADHDVPIETRVEAEPAWSTHARLRGEAGQHALRMATPAVRAALLAAYPLALPAPTDPDADRAGLLWSTLLHARTIDAIALADELRPLVDAGGNLAEPARAAGARRRRRRRRQGHARDLARLARRTALRGRCGRPHRGSAIAWNTRSR